MTVLVPYAAARPKTRLADALDPVERESFSRAMLADVVDAVVHAGGEPTVVATEPVELDAEAAVVVDDRPLSKAVNDRLAETGEPTAVVMSDLALVTPRLLSRFLDASGDVVVAPGRGGGTNALVVRHPAFRVDYHGTSYLDHLEIAREVGASVREFDSMRLSADIDEPEDLVEVLLHTDGRAREWLLDAGFEVETRDGRVGARREG
ncbi:2-phospho-L-lactate guanylyltransferase [Haloprofundus salinisoli]|uniref:2-phospho-L-lactate guanylyltransferase n=1 Tax=Haloprofundus salinisoli TaxID=2876193 RepID=UPI001CCDA53C|nr:2-phospho-L-lactate guanylyltransferase [Haloprofundus salinisoli]